MEPILEIQNLEVKFHTLDGVVNAVNGVSYSVEAGKTLGVVGESGCGKSVSVLSVMRLIPDPPGKLLQAKYYIWAKTCWNMMNPAWNMFAVRRLGWSFKTQ